jgi:hypothetical protein
MAITNGEVNGDRTGRGQEIAPCTEQRREDASHSKS